MVLLKTSSELEPDGTLKCSGRPGRHRESKEDVVAEHFGERCARVERHSYAKVDRLERSHATKQQKAMPPIEIRARPFTGEVVVMAGNAAMPLVSLETRLNVYCIWPLNQRVTPLSTAPAVSAVNGVWTSSIQFELAPSLVFGT